jgi:hypothetical protein
MDWFSRVCEATNLPVARSARTGRPGCVGLLERSPFPPFDTVNRAQRPGFECLGSRADARLDRTLPLGDVPEHDHFKAGASFLRHSAAVSGLPQAS